VDEGPATLLERFQQLTSEEAVLPVLSYLWGRGEILDEAEDAATRRAEGGGR